MHDLQFRISISTSSQILDHGDLGLRLASGGNVERHRNSDDGIVV